MDRNVIITEDGSSTIALADKRITYHSIHGAVQESMHVFIGAGFRSIHHKAGKALTIFEMGFGTGLNALLTFIEGSQWEQHIYYESIENSPLSPVEGTMLNYCNFLGRPDLQGVFNLLHAPCSESINLSHKFTLHKVKDDLLNYTPSTVFDLVYFDAFDPNVQPELWTTAVFEKMHKIISGGGCLVTYSAKGDVKRALISAGFDVEKLPGPPHKREIIRATRR